VISAVLDASALIALLRRERGMEVVHGHIADAAISAVNYSEVIKKTIEYGGAAEPVNAYARNVSLNIVPFDTEQAISSGKLYPATKPYGLSFADRACLNLGARYGVPVLTTEKRMADTPVGVKVQLIRGEH